MLRSSCLPFPEWLLFMCRIWMTATGPTPCTPPHSRGWRTPASSPTTSPTSAQLYWRRMTRARLVSETSAPEPTRILGLSFDPVLTQQVCPFFPSGCQSFPRVPWCLPQTLVFCSVWAARWLSGCLPGQGACVMSATYYLVGVWLLRAFVLR